MFFFSYTCKRVYFHISPSNHFLPTKIVTHLPQFHMNLYIACINIHVKWISILTFGIFFWTCCSCSVNQHEQRLLSLLMSCCKCLCVSNKFSRVPSATVQIFIADISGSMCWLSTVVSLSKRGATALYYCLLWFNKNLLEWPLNPQHNDQVVNGDVFMSDML